MWHTCRESAHELVPVPLQAETHTILLVHGDCLNPADLTLEYRLSPDIGRPLDTVRRVSEPLLREWNVAELVKPKVSRPSPRQKPCVPSIMFLHSPNSAAKLSEPCRTAWPCGCLKNLLPKRGALERLTFAWNFGEAGCSWVRTSFRLQRSGRRSLARCGASQTCELSCSCIIQDCCAKQPHLSTCHVRQTGGSAGSNSAAG